MVKRAFPLLVAGALLQPAAAQDEGSAPCRALLKDLELPARLKSRGKPRRARWEDLDKTLTRLRERLADGSGCQLRFSEVFEPGGHRDLFIPVTNNLVRTAPEKALSGVALFDQQGEPVGEYVSRIAYDRAGGLYARRSYRLFYFQFRDRRGEIQSTGNRLLLDDYLVRWQDLKERVAIRAGESP